MISLGEILSRAEELDLFPAAADRIRSVADDAGSSLADLERAVQSDQTLTAQVLKVANSPFYGMKGRIDTLRQALKILGFQATRDMALALAMISLSKQLGSGTQKQLWQHAVRTGTAAREISMRVARELAGQSFVTGVLHDLGKVVLLAVSPSQYEPIIAQHPRSSEASLAKERLVFVVDHAVVGAECLRRWNLADITCGAVANHHTPDRVADEAVRTMARIVSIASETAHLALGADDELRSKLSEQADSWFGITAEDLEALSSQADTAARDILTS